MREPNTQPKGIATSSAVAQAMEEHWWYRGRRMAVRELCRRARVSPPTNVLDYGCGTGLMGATLAQFGSVTGVEASQEAIGRGIYASYDSVVCAACLDSPAFPTGKWGLITLLDVLEHVQDDVAMLKRLAHCLEPGGALVVSVPLWPELYGPSDRDAGHYRRYTPEGLERVIAEAGYTVALQSGYVVSLLPLARWQRKRVAARDGDSEREFATPPALLNAVLSFVAIGEGWLGARIALPPGLSMIAVLRRNTGADVRDTV